MRRKFIRQDTRGVAMIEFALCLPPVLLLGLTGIEVANFAIANLRISQIAMTTADNAARVRDSIDEYDINELFIGAKQVGASTRFAENGRVILSSVEPRTVAPLTTSVGGKDVPNQWIRWQRCYGMKNIASSFGAPRNSGNTIIADGTEVGSPADQIKSVPKVGVLDTPTGIGPAANQIAAVSGTAVMFVEVFYDYQPLVWTSLLRNRTIRYTSAFNVRQRKDQVMKTAGLAANTWSTCNRYYT